MGISVLELFILLVLAAFILWVIVLIDVLRNNFTGNNKLIWFLIITFVPLIGSIIYLFIGRKHKIRVCGN